METSSSSTPAPILTLTSVDILLRLARLDPSAQHSALSLPLQTHLSTISQDWQDPSALNAFLGLQRFIRPTEEMEEWEPALVPAVALLSAALYGREQVDGAFELVVQAIKERVGGKGDMSVRVEDVMKVLQELYRKGKKEGKSKAKGKGEKKDKTGDEGDVDMEDAE